MDNQTLKIIDRSSVELNNAKKVLSFNTNEFLIETPFGILKILGKNLTIGKMDTEKQELIIKGSIDSLSYQNNKNVSKDGKKENIFTKLFK